MEGIIGSESLVVIAQLSQVMAEKREELLSQVRGWVNRRITIAVSRSYSMDYLQISALQFPAGTGASLVPGIGNWDSRLHCTPG